MFNWILNIPLEEKLIAEKNLKVIKFALEISGKFFLYSEICLETRRMSTMKLFSENSSRWKVVNYFLQKKLHRTCLTLLAIKYLQLSW